MLLPPPQDPGSLPGTGKEFMEKTKYRSIGKSDQQKGLPQPPLELPPAPGEARDRSPPSGIARYSPCWISGPPSNIGGVSGRISTNPITLEELSFLLWSTQGVRQCTVRRQRSARSRRPAPATPSRHSCWQTMWRVWNRGCTATSRSPTGSSSGIPIRPSPPDHSRLLRPAVHPAERGGLPLDSGPVPDDLALRRAGIPGPSPRRRPCLPEPVPRGRSRGLRGLRHRGIR